MDFGWRDGMFTVERDIAAPAEAVWDLLVDLDAWPRWGPTVQRGELDDGSELRLGATGTVWTPVGVPLPFTITEYEPHRRWEWRVGGVPATRHEVLPAEGGCRLIFGVPWWAPAYLPVFVVAAQRIERMAAGGR